LDIISLACYSANGKGFLTDKKEFLRPHGRFSASLRLKNAVNFSLNFTFMISNNDVLKKLRVALKLRDDDIIKILKLVDFEIGKAELSAFFRDEDHPNYRLAGDQVLRNFLNGLIIHLRGKREEK
jgi:uncharacterized protein YehS (DUF1456 family)